MRQRLPNGVSFMDIQFIVLNLRKKTILLRGEGLNMPLMCHNCSLKTAQNDDRLFACHSHINIIRCHAVIFLSFCFY